MTAFVCAIHGAYTDEGYPEFVRERWCPECSRSKVEREGELQERFSTQMRFYRHWTQRSGVPARGRVSTIYNWTPANPTQATAKKIVEHYVERIRDQARHGCGLTILGPPGVGKSHLGYGIVAAACLARIPARYACWPEVVARHKSTFSDRNSPHKDLLSVVSGAPLLVLDELGVREGSQFDQALLFDVIDQRYREQRPTIVCSNLAPDTLDMIGERSADRLREVNVSVSLPGNSHRKQAAISANLDAAPQAIPKPIPERIAFHACVSGEMVEKLVLVDERQDWRC